MRFFVPITESVEQSEQFYAKMRERVEQAFGSTSHRRIYALKYRHDGKRCSLAVGDSLHRLNDEPVLAIFEGGQGYYICTTRHGGHEGHPIEVNDVEKHEIQEFSALQ